MKKNLLVLLAIVAVVTFAGCNSTDTSTEETVLETEESTDVEESTNEVYDIQVIIKGQDSDFWQTVARGAEAAAAELEGIATVNVQGAATSTDFEKQVELLENVLVGNPDAIVLGPASSDGVVPSIEAAYEAGIKIAIVDTAINSEAYDTILATDNIEAGAMAARAMVEALEANGTTLEGVVGIVSPVSGVPTLTNRCNGFIDELAVLAPNIEVLPIVYCDGDAAKALAAAEDIYLSNSDNLVGMFGDSDLTAGAIARAIVESNIQGKFVTVAIDASEEEIAALESGNIYALVVQDPFNMGYAAVMNCIEMLNGNTVEKNISTNVQTITQANMDEEESQKLLYPLG